MAIRGWESSREEGTKPFIGTEFQLWKMEKVLAMDGGEGFRTMSVGLMLLNCTLKNG